MADTSCFLLTGDEHFISVQTQDKSFSSNTDKDVEDSLQQEEQNESKPIISDDICKDVEDQRQIERKLLLQAGFDLSNYVGPQNSSAYVDIDR